MLGGTLWAIFGNQSADPGPTGTSTRTTASTPSSTPTPSKTTVDVAALDLVGKSCEAATGLAQEAGLLASCTPGNPAPSPDQVGLVYSVSPTGNAPEGSQLTLTVYADQTPIGAPAEPRIEVNGAKAGTVTAGSTVQINWDGFTCPSGTGSVVSYNFTAVNGIFTSTGQSTAAAGPNQRPIPLEVGTNTGQALIVSYTVTCSGSGDGTTRESESSPQAQANVQAASTPTPSPSNPLSGGN